MSTTAARLFEHHAGTVYRFLVRETASRDLAEDLTQEVFLRVVRGVHRYDARDREASWLFCIVRHVLTDYREAKGIDALRLDDVEDPSHESGNVMALAYAHALRLLVPTERIVYLLREQAGLSYPEIAQACEITEDAVRSRLYRARRDIKRLLIDGRLRGREDTRGR
jgi:RNA polymerase sigma-70 factor, ECF subfamily